MKKAIQIILFTLAILNLLDMASTSAVLWKYGSWGEGNPLMRWIWEVSPILFITFKTAISAVLIKFGLHKELFSKWMLLFAVPLLVYIGVNVINLYCLINFMF